jgi:hypothetical protein
MQVCQSISGIFVVGKFDFYIKELMYFEILDRRPGPSFDYELGLRARNSNSLLAPGGTSK